ncbi:uncharacterized protein LOC135142908 [Zophobas morio]|uniref:uncharacterized protein LOC135142908 n=1 Tax=Zophobas morio TaxID=2755281 RepID=UPI00308273BC
MVVLSWLVVATTVACSLTSTEGVPFFGLFYDICDDCSEESGGILCDLMCETVECSDEETTEAAESTTAGETTEGESETTTAGGNGETTAGGDETTAGEETTTAAE